MAIDWVRFREIVQQNDRFLLTSHIRPDCDALGSELGMARVLEAVGKDVKIVNGHATPPNLAFIDPNNELRMLGEDVTIQDLEDRQVMMILDTSAWAQLGSMGDVLRTTKAHKIVMDHHVSEDDLGAELFKNTDAEATGRLVAEAADQLQVTWTPEMANPVYAALATDTGWFRFPSTTSETYRLAGRLVDAGADPTRIYCELYEQETLGRSRLRGVILSRLQTELEGRLVHTYVRFDDFKTTGALPQDTEDAINLSLAIRGTQFAIILVEQATGNFKLSFRSRCDADCSEIAEHFHGGGHKAAAGASINGPFEQAQQQVLDYVRKQLT